MNKQKNGKALHLEHAAEEICFESLTVKDQEKLQEFGINPSSMPEEVYSIDCSSLNRVWHGIDMETGKAVKFDVNTLKRATGMFLRRLKLPHPKDYDKWIRYVLIDAYEECPDVFKQQYRAICKEDKETESSCIIRDALAYAELMSKGQAK